VSLASYESARNPERLQASILAALMAGVSTREIKNVQPDPQGTSKSNVSRHWQQAGHKFVDQLRDRDLSQFDWTVLMLDGIRLSKDQLTIVAIGITTDGDKHVLDFDLGSTENAEVCRALMRRLVARGFHCDRRLLAVLDGSDALRLVVKEFFPDSVIQRCLVHKERNIRAKLSKRHWGELARLFKRLRSVQGKQAAEEVVGELEAFLKPLNAEALKSLREAGEDLIALHRLDVPSTLHRNLLSTNAIENSFRNTRRKLGRVTRFRAETDQATRWLAFALTEVEKGFHRISGHKELPYLVAALERASQAASPLAASPLRPPACAPPPPVAMND
jgi:transposase-like protein